MEVIPFLPVCAEIAVRFGNPRKLDGKWMRRFANPIFGHKLFINNDANITLVKHIIALEEKNEQLFNLSSTPPSLGTCVLF